MEAQQRDYSKALDQRTSQTPECLYLHVSELERVRIRAWRCVSDGEQEKRTKDQSFRDLVLVMFSSVKLSSVIHTILLNEYSHRVRRRFGKLSCWKRIGYSNARRLNGALTQERIQCPGSKSLLRRLRLILLRCW